MENKILRTKKYTNRQQRAEILQSYYNSGMTRESFAVNHGINVRTFDRWFTESNKGLLNIAEDSGSFVEVKTPLIQEPTIKSNSKESNIVVSKAGMEIRLPIDLDEENMKKILGVLAQL